jgi:peptidoglycan/LPS O-acetylase OafA/YrhL
VEGGEGLMTPFSYLALLPLVVLLLVSLVVPLVSALATKRPGLATGLLTLLLATVVGFLTEWADGGDQYDWRRGLYNAALSFLLAALAHSKIYKGSQIEKDLHAVGSTS